MTGTSPTRHAPLTAIDRQYLRQIAEGRAAVLVSRRDLLSLLDQLDATEAEVKHLRATLKDAGEAHNCPSCRLAAEGVYE